MVGLVFLTISAIVWFNIWDAGYLGSYWERWEGKGDIKCFDAQGHITTPKSGEARRVDMSRELTQALADLHLERQLQVAANDWKKISEWVFCNETGGLLDPDNVRHRAFVPLLKASGLRRIRFHDLCHTFASLLIQEGESPVYVKEQMGHSSIQVTVDLYGHLIPGGNRQAIDRLDDIMDRTWDGAGPATPAQPERRADLVDATNSLNSWCARQELNLRPAGSKPDALSN